MAPGAGKRTLRTALRARRREVAAARDRGGDAAALTTGVLALLEHLGLGTGATVTAYEARPAEPPTAELVSALQERGVRVLVPLTLPDLDLDWADAADPAATPLGQQVLADVDLVLAPGLAVDDNGTRMGQGGGSYDRTLPRLRPGTPVVVLLHPGELTTESLPREEHDAPVDAALTAEGLHWVGPRAHLYSTVHPPR